MQIVSVSVSSVDPSHLNFASSDLSVGMKCCCDAVFSHYSILNLEDPQLEFYGCSQFVSLSQEIVLPSDMWVVVLNICPYLFSEVGDDG